MPTKTKAAKTLHRLPTVDDHSGYAAAAAELAALEQRDVELAEEARQNGFWMRTSDRSKAELYRAAHDEAEAARTKLEPTLAEARAAAGELREAARRWADERRAAWATGHVPSVADDAALTEARERRAAAVKARQDREAALQEARATLEQLRSSRDPDDVDRVLDAERDEERARRHLALVAETVDELAGEVHDAATAAATAAVERLRARQRTLTDQIRGLLTEALAAAREERDLVAAVRSDLEDVLNLKAGRLDIIGATSTVPDKLIGLLEQHVGEPSE